jgi:UDP-N-acetylmuramate-alanine ligase
VEKINKKHINYMPLPEIENFVKENIKPGDVLVIMGAGDIYNLVEKF